MPTDVISKIGATNSPTTMDYSTLQTWEDACDANITAAGTDKRWIGEIYDQGEFAAFGIAITFSGTTVDSTHYKYLRCATGASFKDKAAVNTTPLYYDSTKGVAIRATGGYSSPLMVQENYVRIEGLQVKKDNSGAGSCIYCDHTAPLIDSCICVNATTQDCITLLNASSGTVKNSLAVSTGNIYSINLYNNAAYGCTAISLSGTGKNFHVSNYSVGTIKNCAGFGAASFTDGTPSASSDYNATDQASSVGAHSVNSLTFSSQFQSTTNDFRALSTGGLKAGTPDSTNTPVDIKGTTRDATTPYIGCWEVAGGGTVDVNSNYFPGGSLSYRGGLTVGGNLSF